MIRSSKVRLKYANKAKLSTALQLLTAHVNSLVTAMINNMIASTDPIPALPGKDITNQLPFGGRINQLLAKEASSNARSIRNKIAKAQRAGNPDKYQTEILNKFNNQTLQVTWSGNLNLDSRFVSIETNTNSKLFDYWINIKFPGSPLAQLPIKTTRHMQDLVSRGYRMKLTSAKICRDSSIHLFFEKDPVPKAPPRAEAIGIDVGRNKSFVTSNGQTEHSTKKLLNALPKKKHGSRNKKRAVRHLKQTIDREIKSIDLNEVGLVVLEKLTGMKVGRRWGNINHHWSHAYIQQRIEQRCEELDVQVRHVHPAYTSQTCSECGITDKKSRHKEVFSCNSCGVVTDADLNASVNILRRGTNNARATTS